MQSWTWILWNLFLAAVAPVMAYALAKGAERFTIKTRRVPWFVWIPLAIGWLVFLPNTCYLLTEWRHFFFDAMYENLRQTAREDRAYMLTVAELGFFFLLYSGFGVICFVLSIRPMEGLCRAAGVPMAYFKVPFFFLISLGVYMGLIVRLNSWDIVTRPGYVFDVAMYAFSRLSLLKVIAAFAFLLWLLYEALDIWMDGLSWRLKQRDRLPRRLVQR